MSFQFDLDPYEAAYAHLLERIQTAIQVTFSEEHAERGLVQAAIARALHIDQSVVSRRLNGAGNITLRSISDLYIAMNREPLANFRPFGHGRLKAEPTFTIEAMINHANSSGDIQQGNTASSKLIIEALAA